jgi:RNA polymerase sigma-54 factor
MNAIISRQKEFFLTGDETKLKPLALKNIAEATNFDLSTISRVVSSKYVQTNFGMHPLRFFFSSSAQSENGEEVSIRVVKKLLVACVDREDKKFPYPDEELVEILKRKGFKIARRTVAKYRNQLGIPAARFRKRV